MTIDPILEAELLEIDIRNMLVAQGKSSPERSGMHASSLLQSPGEWCSRREVLHILHPESAVQGEGWQSWDWRKKSIFEFGWEVHRSLQHLFAQQANVVWSPVTQQHADSIRQHIPPAVLEKYLRLDLARKDGAWFAAELDLTHFDEGRNLFFSPDALIEFGGSRYVIEIKGIKTEEYSELTDDLAVAVTKSETVKKARIQVNLYAHLLGLQYGVILVENKNSQHFKLWIVEHDPSLINVPIQRIYEVKKSLTLVPRDGAAALPVRKCQSQQDPQAKKCAMCQCCFK